MNGYPTDSLPARLKKRLLHVITPLEREAHRVRQAKLQVSTFTRLSVNSQLANVTEQARSLLAARGFRERQPRDRLGLVRPSRDARLWRVANGAYQEILFLIRHSVTKRQLSILSDYHWFLGAEKGVSVKRSKCVLLLATLRPVRTHTLTAAFPNARPLTERVLTLSLAKACGDQDAYMLGVIDHIKSAEDFARRLQEILADLRFA